MCLIPIKKETWDESPKYPYDVAAHLAFLRKMREVYPDDVISIADTPDVDRPQTQHTGPQQHRPRNKVSNVQFILELIFASLVLLLFL